MHKYLFAPLFAAAGFLLAFSGPAMAGHSGDTVKITPLGSGLGEFCGRDRALLFEDPNGTTILYDVGRTVGKGDPRVPEGLDVVLLSSVHSDHLGDLLIDHTVNSGDGVCNITKAISDASPKFPNSNSAEVLAEHPGATMYSGGEMRNFMQAKVVAAGGTTGQVQTLRPGGEQIDGGVKIAVVMAIHSNGVAPFFMTDGGETPVVDSLPDRMGSDNLSAYVGPDHGFILQFTNGLVVYMTADTGQTSDMKLIAGKEGFYGANLAVVNMGGVFSMGPKEAAWAVKRLIKPKSVIPSHANQVSTSGGVPVGSNLLSFISELDGIPIHVPLSEQTMEFNGHGQCVAGAC